MRMINLSVTDINNHCHAQRTTQIEALAMYVQTHFGASPCQKQCGPGPACCSSSGGV